MVRTNGSIGITRKITGTLAALTFTFCALGVSPAQAQTPAPTPNNAPNGATMAAQAAPSSSARRRSDNDIVRDVRRAFTRTTGLNSSGIHVRSHHAAVTLTGRVPQRSQISRAGNAARSVRGVRSVSNRLTVVTRGGNVH
jgi:hyperosmotically inducible periplasmic protein